MLLNISVFLWFGAICPWKSFRVNEIVPLYRLIPLGVLILLFRRIPVVFAMHKHIHQIEEFQQAAFVGFFGPIGVSAVFYLYVSIDFLQQIKADGVTREDAARLEEVMRVVIWFLAICSIVVHGLSIPLGKLGYHLPRTMSLALSSDREDNDLGNRTGLKRRSREAGRIKDKTRKPSAGVFVIGQRSSRSTTTDFESAQEPSRPVHLIEDTSQALSPAETIPDGDASGSLAQERQIGSSAR